MGHYTKMDLSCVRLKNIDCGFLVIKIQKYMLFCCCFFLFYFCFGDNIFYKIVSINLMYSKFVICL